MKKLLLNTPLKKLALLLIFCIAFFSNAPQVSADLFGPSKNEACKAVGAGNCDQKKLDEGTNKLNKTLGNVINILSVVVGVAAVIMLIIGGFRYITSNGDSNQIGAAKNTVIYAIVGLVIVSFAQIIVKFVLSRL